MRKAICIPGNGGGNVEDGWFPYVKRELEKIGLPVIVKNFPDPVMAREKYWLPYITELGADAETILIGYSSGAVAAMRYAEKHQILGSVLVGVCHTDLGEENERVSGYYDHPWDWDTIKKNQEWILEFSSTDDPFIPINEQRFVQTQLETEYYEFTDQGHFGGTYEKTTFPELVEAVKKRIT